MKKWLVAMLGAAAMAVSTGAAAQWYVGGDLGSADFGTEDDTAFKIYGGYQVYRQLGVELGYSQLLDKGGVEVTAWELSGVFAYPLGNRFSLFGRLGLANVDVSVPGASDDKTEFTYGVGVQYDFSPKVSLRGQWQRYDTEEEVDVISVGIVYKF